MSRNLCVVAATQLIIVNLKDISYFFVRASEYLGITPLTGKLLKTLKKSAIFDYMLLDGHKASLHNFSILLKESNQFNLQLKESFLISRDHSILNKNIYPFGLKLFD